MKISFYKTRANLMLLLTAFIWGVTFVYQKTAMDILGPYVFNGVRCLVGAFSLFIISLFFKSKHNVKYKKHHLVEGGAIAGVLLFLATTMQQVGIVTTSAGKAGFITSLYIVMVPIFSLISGKKVEKSVWLGVLFALIGLYLLSVKGGIYIEKGDLIILFSAVFFALHIMCISKYSKKTDAIKLSCLQFLFAGVFASILGVMFENVQLSNILSCTKEIFYTGVLSCAVAFTLQIGAQKHAKPYIASLILSLESVFAVFAGYFILNEILTLKEIIGCIFMFLAVYAAQYVKKPVYGRVTILNKNKNHEQ